MRVTNLRVNHVETPLGFQVNPLSFSWLAEDDGEAKKQQFARIRVRRGEELVYDSGEDTRADSLDYRVNLELQPRTRYHWSVAVGADNGDTTEAESWFETGKMEEAWTGRWITPELEADVPPVIRRKFTLESADRTARLYLCGLGVYEVYLNGKKVGKEYLAPGYHSYDFHLQTQTYDVTEYLKAGSNELQIWLGDGWFRGRLGFDGGYTNVYGDRVYVIGELYAAEKQDGSAAENAENMQLILYTDENWQCKPSPAVFSNIYDGEIYDARLEASLSDADGWNPVRVQAPEKCGPLCDRYSLPIVKKEAFQPIEVIRTPKEEIVLDFGQNLTGWAEFDCELAEGMKIRLTASEIMQDGCFYHENLRTAKTEFTYISDGKAAHVRPHFTFYGFRYMKVEYLDETGKNAMNQSGLLSVVTDKNIALDGNPVRFTAYHLRSDFDEIGKIVTGNAKVNQLFSNAMWGQKDNFLDVPTDCPQRDERLGWTGDAQVFSETACYNMYMPAFYRKYLWDMRAEQSILGGSVPNVVPRLKQGMVAEHGSCPWADAGVVIPWNVYQHYGSKTLLAECYPGMKAWVDCERRKEEALEGPHLVKDGFHFADWLALDNEQPGPFGATDSLYIASAYYYKCTKSVADAAEVLGYAEDAAEYGALAEEILAAIQEKYFDEEGLCVCKTQTGAALAIEFGLIPERAEVHPVDQEQPTEIQLADQEQPAQREQPADRTQSADQEQSANQIRLADDAPENTRSVKEGEALQARVEANDGHLNTGFVGTTILCPALTASGHHKTAVDLLLNEEFPGWLYCVNLGATTIWERWDSVLPDGHISSEGMNSLNHYSYGSIAAWMYGDLCGIRPTEAGFKKARIAPHADERLGFVECTLHTAAGVYRSNWKYDDAGTVHYEVEVPFNAEAEFVLGGERKLLSAGVYRMSGK